MTSPRDESPTGTSKPKSSSSPNQKTALLIFGTRPEAIKLCTLIAALRRSTLSLRTVVCVTGQHRQMLDQVLKAFNVVPDYDLNLMQPRQSLAALTSGLLGRLEDVFSEVKPSLAIVQGDTTSTISGALSAFYAHVPVAHVEAGLRTWDPYAPFPEEMNRLLTARLASLHFAPTQWAANNLLREGVLPSSIHLTGNTGIDALLEISEGIEHGRIPGIQIPIPKNRRLITVTVHRRENLGQALNDICGAIAALAECDDVFIVWPVHCNPEVRSAVNSTLGRKANVVLLGPLEYRAAAGRCEGI